MAIAREITPWVRRAALAALVAWVVLFAQSITHAQEICHHSDVETNRCLYCTIGGPEDDINAPPYILSFIALPSAQAVQAHVELNILGDGFTRKTAARAPPYP